MSSENVQKEITTTEPTGNKKDFIESLEYIFDENTSESKELDDLIKPIKKRFKYTIYYNALFLAATYKYGQNMNRNVRKYYPKKMRGVKSMVLFATLHSLGFMGLLVGGNCLILGMNPFSFMRKHREITERIIEKEGLDIDSFSEIFRGPIKKIENSKGDNKKIFAEKVKV